MQLPREKLQVLYENLFQLADCGIWEWDPQTGKFHANICWEILYGGKPPKTLDLGELLDLLFQWHSDADRQRFIKSLSGFETCYRIAGSVLDEHYGMKEITETFFILRDDDGTPLKVLCCISDRKPLNVKERPRLNPSYDVLTMITDCNCMLSA